MCLLDVQDYRSGLDFIQAGTGLGEANVLDVRGNHDTFNVEARSTSRSMSKPGRVDMQQYECDRSS